MDLGRVGIRPDPNRLCNSHVKDHEILSAAYERSICRFGYPTMGGLVLVRDQKDFK